MKVSLYPLFNSFTPLKENVLLPITALQKRVFTVAILAFGILATSYLMMKYCFKVKPLNEFQQLIQKANQTFARDPNKAAIVRRIEKRLQDIHYQETVDAGKKPLFEFHSEDSLTLNYIYKLTDQEIYIIRKATEFLYNHVGGTYLK